MKKYKFLVKMVDHYSKEFVIEATSMIAAKIKLEEDLEACPLDSQSNTLDSSDTTIKLLKS